MKILLIGANGQLGSDLYIALKGHDLTPLTDKDIDITDIGSVFKACRRYKPHTIINTAAYVRVDDCEDNVELAFNVNALGTRNVAVAAEEIGSVLVHISTDYVLGGDVKRTVPYTEFDAPAPINVYGASKLAGENYVQHLCIRHFIVRTSALFGVAGSMGKGGNFVETMIKLAKENDELRVVNDQVFSPTYAKDLSAVIVKLIDTKFYGIFHITNSGTCSWYGFTQEIIKLMGFRTRVIPISSEEYPQKAARPHYSVLDNYKIRLVGIGDMRQWQEAVRDYMTARVHRNDH
jgi:dTDP-4-dehydrorhamnose reductase